MLLQRKVVEVYIMKLKTLVSIVCTLVCPITERRGSVVVSTSACHAASRGSIPGPGAL